MRHAVIMAGGAGLRLWPLSRSARPKQLLKLAHGKSLLRLAYERVAELLEPEAIYVITGGQHLELVAAELPELPAQNLFGEPVGRDTANAVGLSAAIIKRRDPDATIGVFTADHVITPMDRFVAAVSKAFDMADAHRDALVTMGVVPTRPETGYGYVQRGQPLADGAFEVRRFAEKPGLETAKQYLGSGDYYWNSGMFAWRADIILDQLRAHLPESHSGVSEIAEAWDSPQCQAKLEAIYPTLPKISIDFAVMEKAPRVLVVEMDCKWVDLGSWTALENVIEADANGNVIAAPRTVELNARNNVLVSEDDHLIAAFGVEDLVVVHSPDATLVCRKQDASALKDLATKVGDEYGVEYR
jgi:mannose-1-phosphate guanylyltransferase